jgi:glutaconyl-CoA decarboxylase
MKMENEIAAPSAGTVDKIVAAKGSSVNSGDVLITLK